MVQPNLRTYNTVGSQVWLHFLKFGCIRLLHSFLILVVLNDSGEFPAPWAHGLNLFRWRDAARRTEPR